jgi:N-acetylglutamate synthase-like GNAT family acetyltransferase
MITTGIIRISYEASQYRHEAASLILRTIAGEDPSLHQDPASEIHENQKDFLNYAIVGDTRIVVGVGSLCLDAHTELATLENIAVAERFRRLGIGSKIVEILETKAFTMGYREIFLKSVTDQKTVRFHMRNGFGHDGVVGGHVPMHKSLVS